MHQHAQFLLFLALGVFLTAACSESESGNTVISSKYAQVFHSPNCEWVGKIKKSNKRTFSNAEAAIAAGLKSCKVCCQQPLSTPKLEPEPETHIREFENLN